MDFRLLGPVSAFSGRAEVPLGPPKRRALFALLVLADGTPVGAERITEALWDDRPPTHARTVVYGHVSALRALLRTDRDTDVVTRDGGYALHAAPDAVDLWRFRELVRRSAAPPPGKHPAELLRQGLELWRGPALTGVGDTPLLTTAADRLVEEHLAALEQFAAALHTCGRGAEALALLRPAAERHPLRESLIAAVVRALHQADRQADAVSLYRRTQRRLARELGVDPGAALSEAYLALLRARPPQPPRRPAATPAPPGRVHGPPPPRGQASPPHGPAPAHPQTAPHGQAASHGQPAPPLLPHGPTPANQPAPPHGHAATDGQPAPPLLPHGQAAAHGPTPANQPAPPQGQAAPPAPAHGPGAAHGQAPAHRPGVADRQAAAEPAAAAVSPTAPAAPAVPFLLPRAPAGFVSRADDLAQLTRTARSGGAPLSVITGPAGVGKTSLAVHWAYAHAADFPDGILYADLRAGEPDGTGPRTTGVLNDFLQALGIPEEQLPTRSRAVEHLYRATLAGRRTLVLLDNARDSGQVRPLLPGTPGCTVLVTSRNRLEGLVATDCARLLPLRRMAPADGVRVLRTVIGDDRVAAEPAAAEELSVLCDGLPLALRLAAARLAARPRLALRAMADALVDEHQRLSLLSGEDLGVGATLRMSVQQLPPDAALLFRRLALHVGSELDAGGAAARGGAGPRPAPRAAGR
ncbi:BTAD domain-containing putative transcriptional regulator, partial [Streptomyces sp. NPDC059456]|uniref:AfsR/SARP family transcriptional regulator n=1 Tax=Streptomyces sp. NPDC059456 TaxID=3346838 RepID=UPI00369EC6A1